MLMAESLPDRRKTGSPVALYATVSARPVNEVVFTGRPLASKVTVVTRPTGAVIRVGVPHRFTVKRVTAPPGSVNAARTESRGIGVNPLGLVGAYGTPTFCQADSCATGEPDDPSENA